MYRTSLFDLEYSHACIVVVSVRVHFTVVVVVVVVVVDDEPAASPASMTDDGRSSVGSGTASSLGSSASEGPRAERRG